MNYSFANVRHLLISRTGMEKAVQALFEEQQSDIEIRYRPAWDKMRLRAKYIYHNQDLFKATLRKEIGVDENGHSMKDHGLIKQDIDRARETW